MPFCDQILFYLYENHLLHVHHITTVQNSTKLLLLQSNANSPVKLRIIFLELTASSSNFPLCGIYAYLYTTFSLTLTSLSSLKTGDISFGTLYFLNRWINDALLSGFRGQNNLERDRRIQTETASDKWLPDSKGGGKKYKKNP